MIQKQMKRLFVTIAAASATALFAVYCTQLEFNNPLDPQNKHTLTVNSNLAAGGTVSPSGTSTRSGGDEVVVTATAAAGYAFAGWSGAVSSTASSVTILMDGNKTLTANFQLTFTDSRDGKTYRTVVMPDGKTWMSENLNYQTGKIVGVMAPMPPIVRNTGRLYTWDAAREACHAGWRLPTRDDWSSLAIAAGGTGTYGTGGTAGTALKSQSGWSMNGFSGDNGTDTHGFSALPGGYR